MNAREFVDSLFEGYEETAALADFKEELLANLNAKIESFVKQGLDEKEAFEKASAELGDVSALADELSLRKRKEVFEEAYMDIRKYMSAGRVAAYSVFGVLALFGIVVAIIALIAVRETGLSANLNLTAFFGTMMPFLTTAIIGFTYLGITQETAAMIPVSRKRGAGYATAAGLIAFGLFTMPIVFFSGRIAGEIVDGISGATFSDIGRWVVVIPVISMMIPFILPGIGILVYLILTEKDRLKPWAKNVHTRAIEREMAMWQDSAAAGRFGMFCGALWIFAIGIFILLGFLIGFKFSWLVFIFAVAVQLLVQGFMYRKN